MKLDQLFKVQEIIENDIKSKTNLDEDALGKENTFDLRFLALQVKVGEIVNLTKCYKYYRVKENLSKEKLMNRYIDAMRYLLSIGNIYKFNIVNYESIVSKPREENIIKSFAKIFDDITELKELTRESHFIDALDYYIGLFAEFVNMGELLGFTFDEVYDFYINMGQSAQ